MERRNHTAADRQSVGRARSGLLAIGSGGRACSGCVVRAAVLHQREDAHHRRSRGVTASGDAEPGPWAAPGRCSDAQVDQEMFTDCARLVGGRRGCRSTRSARAPMVLGSFWTLVSSPVTMGERTAAWERPRSRYTSKSHIAPQRKRWVAARAVGDPEGGVHALAVPGRAVLISRRVPGPAPQKRREGVRTTKGVVSLPSKS